MSKRSKPLALSPAQSFSSPSLGRPLATASRQAALAAVTWSYGHITLHDCEDGCRYSPAQFKEVFLVLNFVLSCYRPLATMSSSSPSSSPAAALCVAWSSTNEIAVGLANGHACLIDARTGPPPTHTHPSNTPCYIAASTLSHLLLIALSPGTIACEWQAHTAAAAAAAAATSSSSSSSPAGTAECSALALHPIDRIAVGRCVRPPCLHVTRHTSHVTPHTSHVTRDTSHATRHRSLGAVVVAALYGISDVWTTAALSFLMKYVLLLLLLMLLLLLLLLLLMLFF
jgi:hypothetical protein